MTEVFNTIRAQRKFTLAMSIYFSSTIALFTEYLGGGEYVALCTLLMGTYGAANVMEKR